LASWANSCRNDISSALNCMQGGSQANSKCYQTMVGSYSGVLSPQDTMALQHACNDVVMLCP
jgi:hypothetical protein